MIDIAKNENPAATVQRRSYGTGGVESRTPAGPFRGHYRDGGKLVRLPWCTIRRDAEEQLQAALEEISRAGHLPIGTKTLRKWGEDFLDQRELDGHRASKRDRIRWKYILQADFIDWPLESISRRDVKRWMVLMNQQLSFGRARPRSKKRQRERPTKPLAWQTKTHALNLMRRAFAIAIEEEHVSDDFLNPCFGMRFKKPARTEHAWNFLTRGEIETVQRVAPTDVRPLIEFAIATGLRQGEMRALRDEDVHVDDAVPYITVRYGRPPRKPTKSGQPRDVPLLPMAQRALRDWYAVRAQTCKDNDKGLTFPARYGGYRSEGKFLGRRHFEMWHKLLNAAGVQRHLVWHDLRHTCGTALLGGYFGRKWRLEEIQQMLGHAEVKTTERYAHALRQTLADAARETAGDIGTSS